MAFVASQGAATSHGKGYGEEWQQRMVTKDAGKIEPLFSRLASGVTFMFPDCQLFGTLGCHLCEVAEGVLMPFVGRGLMVELVEITDRDAWVEAYGLRIPVLRRCDSGDELGWPFDASQVASFLSF